MNELDASIFEKKIMEVYHNTEKRLKNGMVTLSTCELWQRGFYCSDKLEAQSIPYVANLFSHNGFTVKHSVNHGVEDYNIYPKIQINF